MSEVKETFLSNLRKNKIYLATIGILLGYIVYLQNTKQDEIVIEKPVVVERIKTVEKHPKVITVKVPTFVEIQKPIAISPTQNQYVGTQTDSILTLNYDIVTTGKLDSFKYDYSVKTDSVVVKEVIKETHTVINKEYIYKSGLYAGGDFGLGINGLVIMPKVGFQNKKGHFYNLGFDVVNKTMQVGVMVPLLTK